MHEPFFRTDRNAWYIYTPGPDGKPRRKLLAKTKRRAFEIWKAGLAASEAVAFSDPLFRTVATKWLERQLQRRDRGEVSADWVDRASRTVGRFCGLKPDLRCSQITPAVAVDWLPKQSSAAYERTEVGTLKQILKWAVGSFINSSPLADLKMEKGNRRELLITLEDHRKMVHATQDANFRAMLWFAWWTGARPVELRSLLWEHLSPDCNTATLRKHKTARKVERPRVLYFNQNAQTLLRAHKSPSGYVFMNRRGVPWTKDALVRRIGSLRRRTGVAATGYAYRHSFITRALLQGVEAATVAELTGTSVEMISRNYGHLDKAKSHLSEVANRLR